MNIIEQWLQSEKNFDEGVSLFKRFGNNQTLLNIFKQGWATFNIDDRLFSELETLSKNERIPKSIVEIKVEKSYVPPLKNYKVEEILQETRVVDDKVIKARDRVSQYAQLRIRNSNKLTNLDLPISEAKKLIDENLFYTSEMTREFNLIKLFVQTGNDVFKPEIQKNQEQSIGSILDKKELLRQRRNANTRRSKANKRLAKQTNNEKRDNLLIRIKKEDNILEEIKNQLQIVSNR